MMKRYGTIEYPYGGQITGRWFEQPGDIMVYEDEIDPSLDRDGRVKRIAHLVHIRILQALGEDHLNGLEVVSVYETDDLSLITVNTEKMAEEFFAIPKDDKILENAHAWYKLSVQDVRENGQKVLSGSGIVAKIHGNMGYESIMLIKEVK